MYLRYARWKIRRSYINKATLDFKFPTICVCKENIDGESSKKVEIKLPKDSRLGKKIA